MASIQLYVSLLTPTSKIPGRQSEGSAGYDLYSDEWVVVGAESSYLVSTGISVELPYGTYGRVAPRSSVACKFTSIGAGVIDNDYRGEVKVLFFNHSKTPFVINVGDRIAQLIVERNLTPSISIVDVLSQTKRNKKGFGSTGK